MKFEYINSSLFLLDTQKETRFEVTLKACFPWEKPFEMLSVKNDEGGEVGLISSFETLDIESKRAVDDYLTCTRFVIHIDKVINIEEDVELRKFTVLSKGSERVFFMELDNWPELKNDGSIVLVDLAGDIYNVKSLKKLSQACIEKLTPYLY